MAYPLIIDTDPGIGDAVAVAAALLDPEIDVVALTGVTGRVTAEQATLNLQAIVALLDPPKWPRLGQGEGDLPVLPASGNASGRELNGSGGLGDFQAYDVEVADRTDADKLMVDLARSRPNELTLLTLGPLTNVQKAIGRDPEFLSLLRGIICLGGSVSVGGDVTPCAEFNLFADAQAARTVLTTPATTTLLPLDVVSRVQFTFDQFDRLQLDRNRRVGRLLQEMLPYYFRSHHETLGQESICLGELAALSALTSPRFFERERMRIDVETSGELTRGMSVFDRRGFSAHDGNIDVLIEVDAQGVLDRLSRLLKS